MKIENMQKNVFFKKHPHFWAKNGERCVFGLKTHAQKRKNEPKMNTKRTKRTQNGPNEPKNEHKNILELR
jgi:hypothetical protein